MSEPPPAKRSRLSANTNEGNRNANDAVAGGIVSVPEGKPPLYFSLLDDKVLAMIFRPLKLYDLLQMYEVHEAYQKVIAEDVMKDRPLNISEISPNYQTRDAFRYLGGFTSEVIIKTSDIQYKKDELSHTEEIMRLIGKRCGNGHLKKLSIVFDSNEKNANAVRTEMPESMLAIDSLTIGGKKYRWQHNQVKCDEFLEAFKERKLPSITLKDMACPENLLKQLNIEELRELTIENCRLRDAEFWTEFFRKAIPSLESFTWNNVREWAFDIGTVDIAKVFPGLKRLNLDARHLKVTNLTNLTHLTLHNMPIFEDESLDFVKGLKECVGSIEDFTIVKPQWNHGYYDTASNEVRSTWLKVMSNAVNLRTVKFDCPPMSGSDAMCLVEQIPQLTRVHVIASNGISWNYIKSLVKRPDIRCIKIESSIYLSNRTFHSLVKYRKKWHNESPPIDIYLRVYGIGIPKRTREENENSRYIRLHALDPK